MNVLHEEIHRLARVLGGLAVLAAAVFAILRT